MKKAAAKKIEKDSAIEDITPLEETKNVSQGTSEVADLSSDITDKLIKGEAEVLVGPPKAPIDIQGEQTIQKPSVGRIVNYFPGKNEGIFKKGKPLAAIVTDVDEENALLVALTVFGIYHPINAFNVVHESNYKEEESLGSGYWAWPARV